MSRSTATAPASTSTASGECKRPKLLLDELAPHYKRNETKWWVNKVERQKSMPSKSVSGSSLSTSTTIFCVARIKRRVAHVHCTQRVHSIVQCSVAFIDRRCCRPQPLASCIIQWLSVYFSKTLSKMLLVQLEKIDFSHSLFRVNSVLIKNLLSHRRCDPRPCLISYLCSSAPLEDGSVGGMGTSMAIDCG